MDGPPPLPPRPHEPEDPSEPPRPIKEIVQELMTEKLFYSAVSLGKAVLVKHYLDEYTDIEKLEDCPVTIAALSRQVSVLQLLLDDGRFDASKSNNRALVLATQFGHTEAVKLLLTDEKVKNGPLEHLFLLSATQNLQIFSFFFNPSIPSEQKNEALVTAVEEGVSDIVEFLLKEPDIDPSYHDNLPIRKACRLGHQKIVELLLADPSRVDPSAKDNEAVQCVGVGGQHIGIMKILLNDKRVDPSANKNKAVIGASLKGNVEMVALLLLDPRVDPSAEDSIAVQYAAEENNIGVVEILLKDPRVNPGADSEFALMTAIHRGNNEVVKLLIGDKRVDPFTADFYALTIAKQKGNFELIEALEALLPPEERTNKQHHD